MKANNAASTLYCPWPGPRPYSEDEANIFFGREEERSDLIGFIQSSSRLCVVAGHSGVGKTSLLRAAVIPRLLKLRQSELDEGSGRPTPPAVMIREWAGALSGPETGLLSRALASALENSTVLPLDRERLCKAPFNDDARTYVSTICAQDSIGGIILFLDQFEEVLRSPRQCAVENLIEDLANIYRLEERAVVVLSLRSEALGESNWRLLEEILFPLHQHTHHVGPVALDRAKVIVLSAAAAAGVRLDDKAASVILDWARGRSPTASDGLLKRGDQVRDFVNLLRIQAILTDLWAYVSRGCLSNSDVAITEPAVSAYRGTLASDNVGELALERYVDKAFSQAPSREPTSEDMPSSSDVDLLRRMAARIVPLLSSGGYKIKRDEVDLIWESASDALERLRTGPDEIAALLSLIRSSVGLQLLDKAESPDEVKPFLSGTARTRGYTRRQVVLEIVRACHSALCCLEAARIVRVTPGHGTMVIYELVHDGFSSPLVNWAVSQQLRIEDTTASLVAICGRPLKWKLRGGERIDHVVWRGCDIADMQFTGCNVVGSDLSGCVFTQCHFQGVTFDGCVLNGTMFQNCRFTDQTRVSNSTGCSMLLRNCHLDGLSFLSCDLDGVWILQPELQDRLEFRNSHVRFGQFMHLLQLKNQRMPEILVRRCVLDKASADSSFVGVFKMWNEKGNCFASLPPDHELFVQLSELTPRPGYAHGD